ncbi:MAG: aminoglycoside phosphotransferase family protein [Gammaproteobacteria bacterium]
MRENILADSRQQALYTWVGEQLSQNYLSWEPLSGDAGARRYFRVQQAEQSYLAVDSPPTKVDNPRFIAIAQGLQKAGLHAPTLFAAELEHGFLLINELSQLMYTDVLTEDNAGTLYTDALQALLRIQASREYYSVPIKPWVEQEYYQEMTDMNLWLLERHLDLSLSSVQQKSLERLYKTLIENMQMQPQVCVHRDYHARNLLYCADHNPGIIDFQDMFIGPITYDFVSLVRDAYVTWSWDRVQQWSAQFHQLLAEQPNTSNIEQEQFNLWFHGMSLQRGLKILGRFPRLCYRDNKPRYLVDLPQVAQNTLASCPYFAGAAVLDDLLQEQIIPRIERELCAP